jgi:nucleotide-binding universal stress UspA family protein
MATEGQLVAADGEGAAGLVGGRGHGAFSGRQLSSASIHRVTYAHCPVVVVRTGS